MKHFSVGSAAWFKVAVASSLMIIALAACGDEEKPAEPAAKEAPAMPAQTEEAASDSPPAFPTIGEEHTPEGELHEAPPIPSEAGQ